MSGALSRKQIVGFCAAAVVGFLVLWRFDVFGTSSSTSPPTPAAPTPTVAPVEAEAIEMAKALRRYYPSARAANERSDEANQCFEAHKGKDEGVRECVRAYQKQLDALQSELAPTDGLTGCSLTVAVAVRGLIEEAIREQKSRPELPWVITFGAIHDGLKECAARLFRFGPSCQNSTPTDPETVEVHLGLQDDEPPGPASFAKDRPWHLCLATGRELDRATLAIK